MTSIMSAVRPPSNPSAANSDTSVSTSPWLKNELQAKRVFETIGEGMPIPSAFIRTEVTRMLQREQEKAVALLETSPLLSYLFFTYVMSAKATPDSPVSDHSEELSALKLRSEKLESELAAAQTALTESHDLVETLREDVQQLRADSLEDRSREAAILEEKEKEKEKGKEKENENEKEKEDLRREAQTYKSEADALRRAMADQQIMTALANQQHIVDNTALQTRLDELQRRFDELSERQDAAATPIVVALEESAIDGMSQSPEQPSTPMWRSQPAPQILTLLESPTVERPGTPEVAPPDPSTRQAPPMLSDAQMSDQSSSSVRMSRRAQKFKAKRIAKKQAREAQEESGAHLARAEVITEAP